MVDDGEEQFGVVLMVIDECGVISCFCLREGFFVVCDVFFKCFTMDSEVGSSVSSLEPTLCGLHPAVLNDEPGERTRERH